MKGPYHPEIRTDERHRACALAARHLRRGRPGRGPAVAALTEAGYSSPEAEMIVGTMLAQMTI